MQASNHSTIFFSWWWIAALAVLWPVGWLVTWAARVDLSFNWAVFGATGALSFAVLSALVLTQLLRFTNQAG